MNNAIKKIYLAGGCFWGMEAYFSNIYGILKTEVGYANGNTKNATYNDVSTGDTGFAETLFIEYNPDIISLQDILLQFFDIVDPTSLNRQGGDVGTQYRTGIYYVYAEDKSVIDKIIQQEKKEFHKPIVVEVKKLENYYRAEEMHQHYLLKNPNGYCHINLSKVQKYKKPGEKALKEKLNDTQYHVTQKNETEAPHSSPLNNHFEDGIYVDVATGEPLFSSKDKYDGGCGWPSFSRPIRYAMVKERHDNSHDMHRTEVRSSFGDSHLGHVFEDGPKETGGQRYCINGAALRFVARKDMKKEGYGDLEYIFD